MHIQTANRLCFVHVGRDSAKPSIKLLPIGLLALADYLSKQGFIVKIIHLGLERMLNRSFDLVDYINKNRYSILLFDLHWHFQIRSVIDTAKELKKNLSKIKIILGGFSASFFAKEIMDGYDEIDFVIKGDAEIPLLKLLRGLKKEKDDFYDVPNLTWRRGARLIQNHHSYIVTKNIIDKLCFSNFKLIDHHKEYIKMFSTGLGDNDRTPIFYYTPGRGCLVNCSFCGGSNISQNIINKRKSIVLAGIKSVLRDLSALRKFKINKVNICFDSLANKKYYIRLFRKIREEKIKLSMDFESYGLPEKAFIDEFAKTFNLGSSITISPETGSDRVRKFNKGLYYTNKQLLAALYYLRQKNIKIYLSFIAGLAFEQRVDIVKTLLLISYIKKSFRNIEMHVGVVEIEPAAPWYLYNSRFGISSKRVSLKDFYNAHKTESSIGYSTKFFSEDEILAIKKLYQTQVNCIYPQSYFLQTLLRLYSNLGKLNISKIHHSCMFCTRYNYCFKET